MPLSTCSLIYMLEVLVPLPTLMFVSLFLFLLISSLSSHSTRPVPLFDHAISTNLQFSSDRMANVVELKVGLHCDECIKKILKAIKKIQDIETYNIDTQLNKVTVTGNVSSEEVTRVIHKIGKTATTWEAEGEEITPK